MTTDESVDVLLKRWGRWLWISDDPGLFYDRVNIIAKLRGDARCFTDWSDAESVNKAVLHVMKAWPKQGIALKCWYEFRPEILGLKEKKDRKEAKRQMFCSRTKIDVTLETLQKYVRHGRYLVAAHLAGQEAA